jgi:hypothetical protein
MRFGRMIVFGGGVALSAVAAHAEPFKYEGVCEASAAAVLDGSHFVVASDETDVAMIYERNVAAPIEPPYAFEVGVTDVEAAARIGETIFWLTSHSLNKDGEDKPKRKVLFATSVSGDLKLEKAGNPYRDLRAALAPLVGIDENTLAESLNIEGLAATPGGDLLVGLRGPLTEDQRALVVKIEKPFDLVGLTPPAPTDGADPIAAVSKLDLGGRGIRSIELVGTGEHTFLIVAGSVEDGGAAPSLYWWDGTHDPIPGPDVSLGTVPEALVVWDGQTAQAIGDNGDNCSDEEPEPRWFPSAEVTF